MFLVLLSHNKSTWISDCFACSSLSCALCGQSSALVFAHTLDTTLGTACKLSRVLVPRTLWSSLAEQWLHFFLLSKTFLPLLGLTRLELSGCRAERLFITAFDNPLVEWWHTQRDGANVSLHSRLRLFTSLQVLEHLLHTFRSSPSCLICTFDTRMFRWCVCLPLTLLCKHVSPRLARLLPFAALCSNRLADLHFCHQ